MQMQLPHILVYQEDPELMHTIKNIVLENGWAPYFCTTLQETVYLFSTESVQAIIIDIPEGEDGSNLLKICQKNSPHLFMIIVAAHPAVDSAVTAMKYGAVDYISGPTVVAHLPEILYEVKARIQARNQLTSASSMHEFQKSVEMVGVSKNFRRIIHKAHIAAREDANILLTGESGTGKELFAHAIHKNSARCGKPLIPVNCGAIPVELQESELFGHVKGSYTGAQSTQIGFFQAAHGGTLFLDEIGNTSLAMQAKLLRVIEDKEIWKVGARRPDIIDVRVIAASNRPLPGLVKEGHFREDLYYRLNVLSLNIPPLRERPGDILPLCQHFAKQWAQERNKPLPTFSDSVLARLQTYSWPGNVRQLRNVVTGMLTFTESDEVTLEKLPVDLRIADDGPAENLQSLSFMEKVHIQKICQHTRWNITRAAEVLGIGRQTLYRKLQQYHLGSY